MCQGIILVVRVVWHHMVVVWIRCVAVPNNLSICVEIDSSAPSLKGGIEFRIDASGSLGDEG